MTKVKQVSWRMVVRALVLASAVPALLSVPGPAVAEAADNAAQQRASAFIEALAADAFQILQDKSQNRDAAKIAFGALLRENFALDQTGLRLIRRYRAANSPIKLTDAQITAYRRALPDFLVNSYSDRLYDFATAKVRVIRTAPRGSRGDVDVMTRITDPGGGRPIDAIWTVSTAGPKPLVTNITVNGVNVALTQEADFNAFIERNGFDALVDFMQQGQ